MGLQRQKVISYTQNAQLEREVEALQRQLEKMEQIDRTLTHSGGNGKRGAAATTSDSSLYSPVSSSALNGTNLSTLTTSLHLHTPPKGAGKYYSSIYPIDEESHGHGHGHNRGVSSGDAKRSHALSSGGQYSEAKAAPAPRFNARGKSHKHGSSSSSDTDNSLSQMAQQHHDSSSFRHYPLDAAAPVVVALAAQEKGPRRAHLRGGRHHHSDGHRDAEESEYVPSTNNSTHVTVAGASRLQQHALRRRVRAGAKASASSRDLGGNSSGFDSDDSANSAAASTNARHSVGSGSSRRSGRPQRATEYPAKPADHERGHRAALKRDSNTSVDADGIDQIQTRQGVAPTSTVSREQQKLAVSRASVAAAVAPSEDEEDSEPPPQRGVLKQHKDKVHRHRRMTADVADSSTLETNLSAANSGHPVAGGAASAKNSGVTRGAALRGLNNKRRYSLDGHSDLNSPDESSGHEDGRLRGSVAHVSLEGLSESERALKQLHVSPTQSPAKNASSASRPTPGAATKTTHARRRATSGSNDPSSAPQQQQHVNSKELSPIKEQLSEEPVVSLASPRPAAPSVAVAAEHATGINNEKLREKRRRNRVTSVASDPHANQPAIPSAASAATVSSINAAEMKVGDKVTLWTSALDDRFLNYYIDCWSLAHCIIVSLGTCAAGQRSVCCCGSRSNASQTCSTRWRPPRREFSSWTR